MKPAARILGTFFLILVISFFLTPVPEVLAKDRTTKTFVDYDGDGFDDNASDADGDGIPTNVETPDVKQLTAESNTVDSASAGMFDLAGGNEIAVDLPTSNSAGFGSRQFVARSLMRNRCSLDSDNGFGSSVGIGLGSIGGGVVCEGGVCHQR